MPPIEQVAAIALIVATPGVCNCRKAGGGSLWLEVAFAAMVPTEVMAKVESAAAVVPHISLLS